MVATQIRLDLNGKKGPDLWARLGESDTRQIVMHPGYFDPEGNWVPLVIDAENIFAKFRIVKPDNTFVIQDASLYLPSDPSIFVVTLPEAATQVAGLGYYDLRIGDGETPDTFLYSAGGRFIVDDDMITDEMIESVASVNGQVFPDDFLTSDTLEEALEDYATKEYVDDAIAALPSPLHVYSTSETEVGKWIDNKTVYEKSFEITLPNYYDASSAFIVEADASYIDALLSFEGSVKNTLGYIAGCGMDATGWRFAIHRNPAQQLVLYTNNDGSAMYNGKAYVTIRYTKV